MPLGSSFYQIKNQIASKKMSNDVTNKLLYEEFLRAIKNSISHSEEYLQAILSKESIITATYDGTKESFLNALRSIENDPAMSLNCQEYCVYFLGEGLINALSKRFPKVNGNSAFTITHYGYTILKIYHECDSTLTFDVINIEIADFFDELCEELTALTVKDVLDKLNKKTETKTEVLNSTQDMATVSTCQQDYQNKILTDRVYDYISYLFETLYNKFSQVAKNFNMKAKYD